MIWNMIATISNSFQSMMLMLILTQQKDVVGASYIAIGFAVANLLMTIGKFGVRNYQVTDIEENYSFSTYCRARYITVFIMAIGCILNGLYNVMFNSYGISKLLVVELLCVYKLVESMEDVYHGRLQQKGYLCIASKIWSLRNITFIIEFFMVYYLTKDVLTTLVIDVISTMVLALWFNSIPKMYYNTEQNETSNSSFSLLSSCIAIAIATFLLMYISNVPKYIIDSYVTEDEQTKINILLMVIYVVTLLSNFMFNPIINKLAILKTENKYRELLRKIYILCIGIIVIVVFGIVFAQLIGRKLLGCIYNVSLEEYKEELLLVIISGGFIALMNLFYMIIIMLRKQKIFYIVFTIAALIFMLFGRTVLETYDFIGLCNFYNIILCIISLCLAGSSIGLMMKRSKDD